MTMTSVNDRITADLLFYVQNLPHPNLRNISRINSDIKYYLSKDGIDYDNFNVLIKYGGDLDLSFTVKDVSAEYIPTISKNISKLYENEGALIDSFEMKEV